MKDQNSKVVYLELTGMEKHRYMTTYNKALPYEWLGKVSHAFYVVEGADESHSVPGVRGDDFEYTNKGIIDFVNKHLGTEFDHLVIDLEKNVHRTEECFC